MYSYLLGPLIAVVFSVPLGLDKFPHIPSIFGLGFIGLAIFMVCKGNEHIMSKEVKRHALERSTVPVGGLINDLKVEKLIGVQNIEDHGEKELLDHIA